MSSHCRVCGRLPDEECCETCHRAHNALWAMADPEDRSKAMRDDHAFEFRKWRTTIVDAEHLTD